ncbi:MAG: hypothetical protein GQ477_02915 [Nanohaloarchaea archaeon]|nr:hypothetical protein [Candidatus Nanohaloarchaea archaeon]
MNHCCIQYIFPEDMDITKYLLPETAKDSNISFAQREDIIDKMIPDENVILKGLLHTNPGTIFGYIHKGNTTTKTIQEASAHLGFHAKYILKTIIAKDPKNDNVYTIITRGNSGNITKINQTSNLFVEEHDIDTPFSIELLDSDLIQEYTGVLNGFCRPVHLNEEYLNKQKYIFIQNKIKTMMGLNTNKALVTFPIGDYESLLIPPKELYKILNKAYPDKITFFK